MIYDKFVKKSIGMIQIKYHTNLSYLIDVGSLHGMKILYGRKHIFMLRKNFGSDEKVITAIYDGIC